MTGGLDGGDVSSVTFEKARGDVDGQDGQKQTPPDWRAFLVIAARVMGVFVPAGCVALIIWVAVVFDKWDRFWVMLLGNLITAEVTAAVSLGGLFAVTLSQLGIFPGATPATYALAGMAGVIGATLHCPLTAFLLVFEITQDYKVILPVMLVAIVSTTCAQFLHHDSIYSDLLRRKGIRFGQLADMTLLRRMTVADVPASDAVCVVESDPAQRLIDLAAQCAVNDFVVSDEKGRCQGMVVGDDVRTTLVQREAVPLMIVGELMRTDLPSVRPGDTLDVVLDMFAKHEVSSLPIVDAQERVTGMITRSRLLREYQQQLNQRG